MKILPLSLLVIVFVGSFAPATAQERVWRDSKNRYFSLIPPKGWARQDYVDARTKVAWRLPADPRVLLSVIVRRATESFEEVKSTAAQTAQGYRARGFPTVIAEEQIGEYRSVAISTDLPGGARSRIWLMLASGLHLNVQFAAPSQDLFGKHLAAATGALQTILPLPATNSDQNQASAEALSWYRRYSFLLEALGEKAAAREIAAEGLKMFPDDPELKKRASK